MKPDPNSAQFRELSSKSEGVPDDYPTDPMSETPLRGPDKFDAGSGCRKKLPMLLTYRGFLYAAKSACSQICLILMEGAR